VLYLDAGDVEETTTRISNLTKGTAMHRLLAAAGCDAAAVGNAAWLRYGPQVVADHAEAAGYPILCANLRPLPGAEPSALLGKVGIVSVTDPFRSFLGGFDGLEALDEVEVVRKGVSSVREQGAELVVVLSHLGYDVPEQTIDDRRLARALHGEIDLIVGAHSHDLLPNGEWIEDVLIVQAGSHGSHLGRVDVSDGTLTASVVEVPPETPRHPGVLAELEAAEAELGAHLQEVLTDLPEPLDQEAAALWLAGIYRERMGADVGLATPGVSFEGGLPGGPLTRGALWEACHSSGNPGVVTMTGEQLLHVLERGRDPEFALTTTRSLRGRLRGVLQASGADGIESDRSYAVAGCDFELEPYGGMVEAEWGLTARYDVPTIVREAIEEHLRG
jgi:2',3'-cyclic-nucleotide 2'-phosphodiesterase (5'-nucleotidase family)